ncbi:MAG: methanol--corrinoid methyltransferase [Alphaproteobacteria bacterium]|jgi:methanol--5-hydroxybenzimidazolylcobamide Co-methyltransferase|nr:methanol--corrinoid methyltransferase [Alphaproteobacteria bacterium]
MQRYAAPAIVRPEDLLFAHAPRPVTTRSGMVLGGGTVYPELNFTLPSIHVHESTLDTVDDHYRRIITEAARRAVELDLPGLVVEFETVPPMTEHPDWAMRVVRILLEGLAEARDRHGLKSVLRLTPNDNREFVRPPRLSSGRYFDAMLELFDRGAEAGAELLSIESVGGKEIHDEALQMADLGQIIFALCVLGERDMRFLWTEIGKIADRHGLHAAGDSACGFGNTAMVLAEQKMIPRTLAAVDRVITVVRALVAHECGAVGPGKDCAYENIYLKAITGCPMANEGKSATCAHLSPVGNIAMAACDTWSNESVQNIKLLGGMAPTCMLESLAYDCRLMNTALADGRDEARRLRDWLVRSDAPLDPQAWVLKPDVAARLSQVITEATDHYQAGRAVAAATLDELRQAYERGELKLDDRELPYMDMMRQSVEDLPADVGQFIEQQKAMIDPGRCDLAEYDLA